MKIKSFLLLSALCGGGILFSSNENGRAFEKGQGATGAPGDEVFVGQPRTCATCHKGGSYSVTPLFEIFKTNTTTPVTSYQPDSLYDVRVTMNATAGSPSVYGFQCVALRTTDNSDVAGWVSAISTNVRISTASANGHKYAEQKSPSSTNNFSVRWKAPHVGSGDVKFYLAGIAANGNGNDTGDNGVNTTFTLTEAVTSAAHDVYDSTWKILGNPTSDELCIRFQNTSGTLSDYELCITSMAGVRAYSQLISPTTGTNYLSVPLANLPSGIYAATLLQNNTIQKTALFVRK
jgi:hypothetical protein